MKVVKLMILTLAGLVLVGTASAADDQDPLLRQDPEVLRFVERAIPWYPNSSFEVVADQRTPTPSGTYRVARVSRTCDNRILTGEPSLLIDEATGLAYLGSVGELPFEQTGTSPRSLRPFLEGFLPEVMLRNMNMKVRVSWDPPEGVRAGAIIPFTLVVNTGYGEFSKPVAVTADGRLFVMGAPIPFDQDPVAYRKELFDSSEQVIWDSGNGGEAKKLEIVEFSDLECPACRVKWPTIKSILESKADLVRHGMVSFPLTSIHPWAFRASSATWCVGVQDPAQVIPFKELFYELQRDMEVSLVTDTSVDFVVGQGLDETAFRSCYLRTTSLDAVHRQLALGHQMGVNATPTYFVNGWMIQMPSDDWFPDLIARLAAGQDP